MASEKVIVNVEIPKGIEVEVSVVLPFTVAGTCLPVSIINQDSVEIASVHSGGTYNVVELSELVDDEDLNTTTVLDNI